MTDYQDLIITPLDGTHNRPRFQCGIESLDNYLKKQAGQDIKRRISRVFIASRPESPSIIVGYYTLSTLSIGLNDLPANLARKLPKHSVPSALIGRLAVSQDAQHQGVGTMLLSDAIKRTLSVSNDIAIYALVVDAINEPAANFYLSFGFIPMDADSNRFFLQLETF